MIARVRGVIAASMAAGEMLKVTGSMSTNTGRAARVVDRARGREEGERRRDHLVARLEVERPERQQQRVGPAGAADGDAWSARAVATAASSCATSGPMMNPWRSITAVMARAAPHP